jgi:membrane protein
MDLSTRNAPSWFQHLLRIGHEMRVEARHDSIALVAAGVAFYAVLAVLPALFVAVSVYGLFTDIGEAERQIDAVLEVFPGSAAQIIDTQMRSIAAASHANLSIGFFISLAVFTWTVSNATRAIVRGVKIAYDQEDGQSVLEGRAVAVGITVSAIAITLFALAIIAAVPIWLQRFDPTQAIVTFGNFRWLLVGAGFALVASLLYRYAPPRRPDGWHTVLPGTIFATAMWTATSIGFSIYVSSFGRYNETYGTLGAAVVLLLWFWFTTLAILLGAELNEALILETDSATTGEGPSRSS